MEIYKNKFIKKVFTSALFLCALCEFIIIQYFNIFEAKEHLGIDSSWEYLKAEVLTKEGGIFPIEFLSESTSPGTDKIFSIIAPLNRIIGNVWLSFGLGTMVITLVTIYVLWELMNRINFDLITKLIIVNLFLCPYLSNGFDIYNDLGYYSCVNGTPAYENTVVFLIILMLYVMSSERITKKEWTLFAIGFILFFFKGMTSGISIVLFCGSPAIVYVLSKVFLNNNIKELISGKAIFLYMVNIAIIIGRLVGGIIGYSYGESNINWITAPEFFENIQHEFLAYMLLVGAVPGTGAYRSPTSLFGMSYMFGLIIFIIVFVAVAYNVVVFIKRRMWQDSANDLRFFCIVNVAVISLQFGLLQTNVGQDIFETRYLITALLCGFLFVGYFIQSMDEKLLFKQFGLIILAFAIAAMNLFSDYIMAITDNSSFKVDEVQAVIEKTDAELVYFWDEDKTTLPTYEIIRVTDFDRVYKSINGNVLQTYGQYKYYDDSSEYKGPTILVLEKEKPAAPKEIIDEYERIGIVDYMEIYYCKTNPIDLNKYK